MRIITSFSWISTMLFSSMLVAATETQTYFNGQEERSITMQTTSFSPSHPECNKPRAPITFVAPAPIAAAVPIPEVKPAPVIIPAAIDTDKDGVIDPIDECPNTPRGYKVDTKGCPSSVTLHMNFASNSSVLPKSSDKDIQILTEFMQDNPAATITIIGHTDSTGKAAKNLVLSKARAEALSVRIIENGISDKRIISEGKGLSEPIASNKTKKGRAQNRRINIQIR
uniref:OmpA-like domain-containing protein n=1 Tax=uncultured bacterium pL TaxID=1781163 RepID=A0A1C9U597_9BACT|nr:hypothetical protein [uncultured bacterium pL]